MFGLLFADNLRGAGIKKAAWIFSLILWLAAPAHAAKDPLNRGIQLYKKHHYEDAIRVLYAYLPSVESERRPKTYLALGMICLANAGLYQELHRSSLAANLDYLNRLATVEGPSKSHLVHFYLAKALLEAGRLSEAQTFFEKFLAAENSSPADKDRAKIDLATTFFLQNAPLQARELWSQVQKSRPQLLTSLAAAYSRVGIRDQDPLALIQPALERLQRSGKAASIQIINNLICVFAQKAKIDAGFDLIQKADLKASFQQEVLNRNKVIRFYDAALLSNLSSFYAKAAQKFLETALSFNDKKVSGPARYYLGMGYGRFGRPDQSLRFVKEFISSATAGPRQKNRARIRQAFNHYLLGNPQATREQLNALLQSEPDSNLIAEMLLAATRYQLDVPQVVIYAAAMARRGQGKPYARINFALGKYYLWKKNVPKAISYMEAGRDKSHKNRIEFNDPFMLVNLAQAYYRSRQFSEALEIFFEMSNQYPAVRQIQDVLQGIYIMEQKSAGDVKIF